MATVRVRDNVLEELENLFNPNKEQFITTNYTAFVSEAVLEKITRIKKEKAVTNVADKKRVGK